MRIDIPRLNKTATHLPKGKTMFRGFDTYLISRVDRAKGDTHYFSVGALRFFDAFGGATFALPHSLDPERRFVVIVESVKSWEGTRHYRPTVVLFTPDVENSGETVEIFHPYDLEISDAPTTGATATRRASRYQDAVHTAVVRGADVGDAARDGWRALHMARPLFAL